MFLVMLAVVVGCGLEATEPTTMSCQVITGWAEPVTVTWPLHPDESTEPTQEVNVDGLVGVTISYTGDELYVYTYDASADGIGTISSSHYTNGEHLQNVSEIGDTIVDKRQQHPGTRQDFRVLCQAA